MEPSTPRVLTHLDVLDTRAGKLLPDRHVMVRDGRITEVSTELRIPDGAEVLDLGGAVLMPGLADAHVHITAASADFGAMRHWPASYLTAHAGHILRGMLERGFTTIRDAGGADFGLAQAVEEGLLSGPRVLFCGRAISQTGGHGDMRSRGEDTPTCFCQSGLSTICDGVPEMRRAVRDEIRKGATQIKLMVSGGVASPTDRIDSTQFSLDELRAAVEEASAANIYVMAHAYTARAINRALDAGIRSIEHGNLLDDTSIARFLHHDAFLVPTLATYHALADEGLSAGLSPAMHTKLFDVLDAGTDAVRRAHEAGVKIVFGSDLLGPMHRRQLDEFALRGKVQPAADVIRSATVTAAELFCMTGEIGEVIPGARADLLVLDGNPLDDLGVLQDPERFLRMVWKDGEVVVDRRSGETART
jgi:imidazolonepropionase-like amidohydrolase